MNLRFCSSVPLNSKEKIPPAPSASLFHLISCQIPLVNLFLHQYVGCKLGNKKPAIRGQQVMCLDNLNRYPDVFFLYLSHASHLNSRVSKSRSGIIDLTGEVAQLFYGTGSMGEAFF